MDNKKAIVISVVSKSFGKIKALEKVSFEVNVGDIFGYLGPNGAGKTTTIRIILGLLKPDEGHVSIFGSPLSQEAKKDLGVVLEHPGVYEKLTAYENLEYFGRLFDMPSGKLRARIEEVLKTVGLWGRRDDYVRAFSKGMKQRLAIARALLPEPKILIFDEPTAGLDPSLQKEIRDLIVELSRKEQRTIFLSSHNLDEVQKLCSHIGILNQGKLVGWGNLDTIRKEFSVPTLVITVSEDKDIKQIGKEILKFGLVRNCQIEHNKFVVSLKDERFSAQIIKFLIEQGVTVQEAELQHLTLEDIYFSLVKGESD